MAQRLAGRVTARAPAAVIRLPGRSELRITAAAEDEFWLERPDVWRVRLRREEVLDLAKALDAVGTAAWVEES
jgi:hypothetical protein